MKTRRFADAILIAVLGLVAMAPTAAADVVPAPAADQGAIEQDLRASADFVDTLDFARLLDDRDYAAELLGHLDRIRPTVEQDRGVIAHIDGLRMVALARLERSDEAGALLDRRLTGRSRTVRDYAFPFVTAALLEDRARLVATVETASRNVPGVAWSELRGLFQRQAIGALLGELARNEEKALRTRLAAALFRIGWPGDADRDMTDRLRFILLEDRLDQGDRAAAIDFAAGISTPDSLLPMIVQRKYDDVLLPGQDRLAMLRRAIDGHDRETSAAAAASPDDPQRLLNRAYFLRGVGRNADAVALLEPFTRDIAATVAGSENGLWLINEAAYALVALDRGDDAVALMARMAALSMEEHPGLISTNINYSAILLSAGRPEEAMAYARQLEGRADGYASDYGKMWIATTIACSLARLDRAAEAAPQLARLREFGEVNAAALMHAYLCLGELDAAADFLVSRLEGDDPGDAIMALQNFTQSRGVAQTGGIYDQIAVLRERPAVRAALDRVGHVFTLPMARSYWGSF